MFNSFHLDGVKAFARSDYQIAKALFLKATNESPEEPEGHLFLGKSIFFCDEKNEAIAPLKKYIECNQYNLNEVANISYAFDLLGQCYEAGGKDALAITAYTTAMKIYPLAASAWHNLGLLYIKSAEHYLKKDYPESVKDCVKLFKGAQRFLEKALEIGGPNPIFLHSVASWYEKYIGVLEKITEEGEAVQKNIDNNFELAISYYEKALAACCEDDIGLKDIIRGNLSECLAQYGHHLYKAENFVGALVLYSQAIKLDPDHLGVINQIGMCFLKQNLFHEARKYFSDILDKASDREDLDDAWLNIGCTYRFENDENALNEANKCVPEDREIVKVQQNLMESISQASWVSAPQTMFSHPNTFSQTQPSTKMEEQQLKLN